MAPRRKKPTKSTPTFSAPDVNLASKTPQIIAVKRSLFLAEIGNGKSIRQACEASGISRSTITGWLKEDIEFKDAFDEAEQGGVDMLYEALFERATNKVRPDTIAAIFLLKSKRPEYRDNFKVEVQDKREPGPDIAKTIEDFGATVRAAFLANLKRMEQERLEYAPKPKQIELRAQPIPDADIVTSKPMAA